MTSGTPFGVRSWLLTFPVVSADSDHRLLSKQPFGLRWVSHLYSYLCEFSGNGAHKLFGAAERRPISVLSCQALKLQCRPSSDRVPKNLCRPIRGLRDLKHGCPRLAKPRLGLSYDRCFPARLFIRVAVLLWAKLLRVNNFPTLIMLLCGR